jgi:hypothetical protein
MRRQQVYSCIVGGGRQHFFCICAKIIYARRRVLVAYGCHLQRLRLFNVLVGAWVNAATLPPNAARALGNGGSVGTLRARVIVAPPL